MTGPTNDNGEARAPALRVDQLAKRFDGAAAPVWSEVSFAVPAGQSVAIIGGNGTGKSTLLRCCLRLIEPSAGDIHLHGERLTGSRAHHLRRMRSSVGFVFQKHNLVPRLSALSNVLHGGLARGSGGRLHQGAGLATGIRRSLAGKIASTPCAVWSKLGWPIWPGGAPITCPAANRSGWRSPAP